MSCCTSEDTYQLIASGYTVGDPGSRSCCCCLEERPVGLRFTAKHLRNIINEDEWHLSAKRTHREIIDEERLNFRFPPGLFPENVNVEEILFHERSRSIGVGRILNRVPDVVP